MVVKRVKKDIYLKCLETLPLETLALINAKGWLALLQVPSSRRLKVQTQNYLRLKIPFNIWLMGTKALVFPGKGPAPILLLLRQRRIPGPWEGSLNVFVSRSPRKYPILWNQ